MALFDLPAALFGWMDGLLSALPPLVRLLLWAMLGALVSMEVYRLLSPQARIARLKTELAEAQKRLSDFDGEFADAGPLIGRMLALALKRVWVVLPATLAGTVPLIALILWLDTSYARNYPQPGQDVAVEAGGDFQGRWEWPETDAPPTARITAANGETVEEVRVEAPVPVIHKKRWWNVIIGNPAGYLSEASPVDAISLDLPRLEVHHAGPAWLRRWEVLFFPALILIALSFKTVRRIQ